MDKNNIVFENEPTPDKLTVEFSKLDLEPVKNEIILPDKPKKKLTPKQIKSRAKEKRARKARRNNR